MYAKKFALSVLAYVVVSFALGFTWHFVLFADAYRALGAYTRAEPIFAFGLASMLIQGAVLAYLYPFVHRERWAVWSGVRFGMILGVFLWSVSILAFAAKSEVGSLSSFVMLGSLFHFIQFLVSGALIGTIHGTMRSP